MPKRSFGLTVAVAVTAVTVLAGCGSAEVNASTTCREFLAMDEQTQRTGVQELAVESDGSAFKGPMGIFNVVYDCQESPNQTLGSLMGVD